MKFSYKNSSLKIKLLSVVGINIGFFILITVILMMALKNKSQEKKEMLLNLNILYNIQNADMMHDAVRADVYRLLFSYKEGKEVLNSVKSDFKSHSDLFVGSISNIENTPDVDKNIITQVKELKPALIEYLAFAGNMLKMAQVNDSAAIAELKVKSEEFQEVFDKLAIENEKLSELILNRSDSVKNNAEESSRNSILIILGTLLISVIISILFSTSISNNIQKKILVARDVLNTLSEGNLPETVTNDAEDELGQMVHSINKLNANLANVKFFADEVGKGKFDSNVSVFNEQSELGISLNGMRLSLASVADEDKKRNWATAGIAQVGDVLRLRNKNIEELYQNLISFVVKYLNANQGGLFLVNNDVASDIHIELVACYAYEKRKFIEKRVEIGEGLLGQCYLEKEMIYMTDVPDKYTVITSGLGDATPGCIVLVPLIYNEEITGVIEIASFKPFENYKLDFIKKLAESIASTTSSLKINQTTTKLLEQTQQQTEEMRAQEEEMRQNMEEMQATQEEFYRKEQNYLDEIAKLKSSNNA